MGVGLNWKVWTVTPCGDCAAALPAPSASATAATSLVPCHRVPIAASSVAPDRGLTQDLRRWARRGLVAHERAERLRDGGSTYEREGGIGFSGATRLRKSPQAAKKGPDARRRPKVAREPYSLYVERAAEGAARPQ